MAELDYHGQGPKLNSQLQVGGGVHSLQSCLIPTIFISWEQMVLLSFLILFLIQLVETDLIISNDDYLPPKRWTLDHPIDKELKYE